METIVFFPIGGNSGDNPGDGLRGPPVSDGGVLYIATYDEEDQDYDLIHKTSLDEIVSELIHGLVWFETGKIDDPEDQKNTRAVISALRAAVDKLEKAMIVEKSIKGSNVVTKENHGDPTR